MTQDDSLEKSLTSIAIRKPTPAELSADNGMSEQDKSLAVLKGNTFGILESEGTPEEKAIRLIALLPMAFQVMDEARTTISNLRDKVEELERRQNDDS